MKKGLILLVAALAFSLNSWSQADDLRVQVEGSSLYLVHTVIPKENWYSIGRLFNLSPKEIAPFNHTTMDRSLVIGENLRIPLTAVNFSQTGQKATDETLVAVYHTVQDRETLFKISNDFNKVGIDNLQKWNHLAKDQAKAGTTLIVGYLKVKPALSALAASAGKPPVAEKSVKMIETHPIVPSTPAAGVPAAVVKGEKKADAAVSRTSPPPVYREETKTTQVSSPASRKAAGSYFSVEYNEGSKSASGQAGTFKSTSGWQDGKYYALFNNAPVGTIVKITCPDNNKTVYAKVLGTLPDMKESAGLTIRISNAAAYELGQAEGKFNVDIKY